MASGTGRWARGRRRAGRPAGGRRALRIALLGLAALLAILAVGAALVSLFADDALRRLVERRMNERLTGYRVAIGEVDLHWLGLGADVRDVVVVQGDAEGPALARVAELNGSVEWRALLRGALVADLHIERPVLHLDLAQLRREARDEVPVHERGWQDAIQAVMPLEINHFELVDGEATYVDEAPEPLRLRAIRGEAANVRNVASGDREYPSTFSFEAEAFERGRVALRGRADFLAKPLPAVATEIDVEGLPLERLRPVLERQHIELRDGTVALSAEAELGRTVRRVHVHELVLHDLAGDYVRTPGSAAAEPEAAREGLEAARELAERPELQLRADRVEVRAANVGVRNVGEPGRYRVFWSPLVAELENFSDDFRVGTARALVRGRFMGSGETEIIGTFEPEREGPEFELAVRIEDTELRALNDLLRAYGSLDVTEGHFSLYSEVRVADGRIDGYVKPLFRDLDVHDPEQDEDDPLLRRAYEGVVGAVGGLLENEPREEVATQTDLSGPLEDPRIGTWQLLGNLVENAFISAILPGFQRELEGRE